VCGWEEQLITAAVHFVKSVCSAQTVALICSAPHAT
jgi:hypothetical protein